MKQGIRLLLKPGTFFNQLQWSAHHWLILVGFLVAASVETQLGSDSRLFQWYADFLTIRYGLNLSLALWVVTAARLAFLLAGAWVVTVLIWIVGSLLGQHSSRRVLLRRLAVVFTILLAAFTSHHLSAEYEYASPLSLALYAWGISLGYFAISEQFRLSRLQGVVVVLFAAMFITQLWRYSTVVLRVTAIEQANTLSKSNGAAPRLQYR